MPSRRASREPPGPQSSLRRLAGARALPALVLVVTGCAVVAVAASGVGLLLPPLDEAGALRMVLRVVGALALAAGVAGLIRQRRGLGHTGRGRDPTIAALVTAGAIMAVLAALSLLAPAVRPAEEDAVEQAAGRPADPEAGGTGGRSRPGGSEGGFGIGMTRGGSQNRSMGAPPDLEGVESLPQGEAQDRRVGNYLLLLLLLAAAWIGLRRFRRRLAEVPQEWPVEPIPLPADEAAAGLEASLLEVREGGSDPRDRITAAYFRLLSALADAGAPREAQEAPHEYLHRVLGPLGVRAAPLHRLADLYVVAQFSERPVTERHRQEAADALEEGLRSLRARSDAGPLVEAGS